MAGLIIGPGTGFPGVGVRSESHCANGKRYVVR